MSTNAPENASSADRDSEPEDGGLDLFVEPADYYPPSPTPTTETHTMLNGQTLTLTLVGHNPLWGHHLWQAGRIISTYLEQNSSLVANKTVLELGAGAGLPSLVCRVLGARKVVVSDYPDPDLVSNLWKNIDRLEGELSSRGGEQQNDDSHNAEKKIIAEGYCWGADPTPLLTHIQSTPSSAPATPKFDILLLADLLFNHSEHQKLLSTITLTLAKTPEAKALVFFTPYRPWLYEKDMAFFELAREQGFRVEKVLQEMMERVMFVEDRGDEELRRTVFGWVVRWDL